MKNVRVKVAEHCGGYLWWFGIYEGRKELIRRVFTYVRKGNAIRNAKAMSKRIGIPYSDEIVKQHGC